MTNAERTIYKRFAKECCKNEGIKVNMNKMELWETGSGDGKIMFEDNVEMYVNYVMFLDRKSGKVFQCKYGARYYSSNHPSLFSVNEYVE